MEVLKPDHTELREWKEEEGIEYKLPPHTHTHTRSCTCYTLLAFKS